jgi:hypothetical protein
VSQEAEPLTGAFPAVDGQDEDEVGGANNGGAESVFVAPTVDSPSVFDQNAPVPSNDNSLVVPPAATQPPKRALRAGDLPSRERRRRVRLQARRVRRIVRHIEPWSVLKISVIFYLCLWVILMIAGVMLWGAAESAGAIEKIENFVRELFALDEFTINAERIFRGVALSGFVLVIAGTAFNVLLAVLFNLISDLTGGLRVTVIEEESARFRPRRSGRPSQQVRRQASQAKTASKRPPAEAAGKGDARSTPR